MPSALEMWSYGKIAYNPKTLKKMLIFSCCNKIFEVFKKNIFLVFVFLSVHPYLWVQLCVFHRSLQPSCLTCTNTRRWAGKQGSSSLSVEKEMRHRECKWLVQSHTAETRLGCLTTLRPFHLSPQQMPMRSWAWPWVFAYISLLNPWNNPIRGMKWVIPTLQIKKQRPRDMKYLCS